LKTPKTFSQNDTLVKDVNNYSEQIHIHIEGKELYELKENGDLLATELLDKV